MNLILKKMPGGSSSDPTRFRVMFSERPDEHPQEFYLTGDARDLERFLVGKLDVGAATAARVTTETIYSGTSFIEKIPFDNTEVKLLLRNVEAETKLAETTRRKGTVTHEATQ
jgi:hypothetical protein